MSQNYRMIIRDFQRLVVEGSSYEVGWQQGEVLKRQSQEAAKWFSSAEVNPSRLGFSSFKELQSFYEENCPGITDEIQGLVDSLGVEPEKLRIM